VPAILDTLGPDSAMHVAPIEEVTLDQWSAGPVLLIGDAAHATSPNTAEGAAMALEDGLVSAECLASGHSIGTSSTPTTARFSNSPDDASVRVEGSNQLPGRLGLGSCAATIT
jgi:2-polyprenyl-6-methoxyphenol hydroxylase-like FAD-dependent oxidoreductase